MYTVNDSPFYKPTGVRFDVRLDLRIKSHNKKTFTYSTPDLEEMKRGGKIENEESILTP